MKITLKIVFVISLLICFILFLNATDINESIRLIKQLGSHVLLILLVTFASYLAGTLAWRFCIDSGRKIPFLQLFMIRHTGNIITLFNPTSAVAGELFNARMLMRTGVSEQNAYKSVLLGRILMASSQLFLFLIVLVWFLSFLSHRLSVEQEVLFFILAMLLLLIILVIGYLLLRRWDKIETAVPIAGNWGKIIFRMKEMRFLLAEYIHRRPRKTSLAFLFFTMQWLLSSLELFFMLYLLKFAITVWDGLFLDTAIILLKSTVSFIPGQLGVEELINKFTLHLIGIDSPDLWLSVSILRRTRQLFWSGVALLFYFNLKKSNYAYNG